MDAAYLEATVAAALVQGLAATVEFQPEDSVDFLGKYLLKLVETEELKAKDKAETAQLEVDRKQANEKAAADASASAKAASALSAAEKQDQDAAAKLAGTKILDAAAYKAVLDHIQAITGATGVYVAVKSTEGAEDDPEAQASLSYLGASSDHQFMLEQTVKQPRGATFAVWVRPPQPEADEEELDDEGNPKPKPPPPELEPLHIQNVLKSEAVEFFKIPRRGALLAVPFEFSNLSHPGAIPPPEEPAPPADDGAPPAAAAASGIPKGIPKLASAAIVLDTLGQGRAFSDVDINNVKVWAKRLATALNASELAAYDVRYVKLQEEKAAAEAAAAAAAAAASAEPAPADEAKDDA